MNQPFKVTYSQYAVGQSLPFWGNLEGWSRETMFEKYPSISPYTYCANNPVMFVDPTGEAWKPTMDENTGDYTGYQWIDPKESYNEDGTLKAGLYEQAIFFSDNRNFNSKSNENIGSSTATVYKSDGSKETFSACTNPSDPNNSATVPAGLYEAKVGTHNGKHSSYIALKMSDIGSSDNIELGFTNPNPAYTDGRTYASGIDVHKAGSRNKTSPGVSEGCLLIDIYNWSDFINIFNTSDQKNNTISVTVSRTRMFPIDMNVSKIQLPIIKLDKNRIAIPSYFPNK